MSDEKDFINDCLEDLLPFLNDHFKTKTKLFFDRSVYDMVIDWINQNIYVITFDVIERYLIEQRGVVKYIDQTHQLDQIIVFFLSEKAKFEEE